MDLHEYAKDPGWPFLRQTLDAKSSQKKYDVKRNVWVPDGVEGFVDAEIKSAKGDQIVIVTSMGTEKTVHKDEIQQMNPPKFDKMEDMSELTFLNEASVLHNLRRRYDAMMIYTYSGLFCVVINPYKKLPIYGESVCRMYMGKRRNEMPPHIFAVCDEAYRSMVNDHENQSMLITGESGAGKTENTKKVISYFAIVGGSGSTTKKKAQKSTTSLEDQIVRTNPVLEAFGNAKTVRNNNSSRFGKYIRIHFNSSGKLAGGDIEHYLLEKSRVIKQAPGERSYHIFYQIMSGAIKGLRTKLFLERDIRTYRFVSQAEVTIEGVDDKEEMATTDESFDIMRFTELEKFELFSLTAAIMHMGELKFKQRPREEQAECEDHKEGELACRLAKVDVAKFMNALLKPRVKVGSEWVGKGQNLEQVTFSLGALAKAIYSRMFHWLIRRCNASLDAKDLKRELCIGVLDIAGFEIFDLNSFEQLWINYVNERLQQFFNHHMFVLEQEEYKRENLNWEFIDFGLDLQACIELIEKPLGIISMLDEECIVPKASDMTLAQKLNDQHLGKHPNFQKAKSPRGKQAEAHFAIVHYAGTVSYNVKFWLEKNKDPLNDSVVAILKANDGHSLMNAIWEDYQTQEESMATEGKGKVPIRGKKKGKSSSFMTVSMMYRESLNNLMQMLHQTHPHFIRCIIPNEQKKSGVIEANLVLNQLTCNGVLEGIRICRKGFPNRVLYDDFKHRYAVLAAVESTELDSKRASQKMCSALVASGKLKSDDFQCGVTKIFFRAGILALLEEFRDESLSAVIEKFQRECRYYLAQCNYRRLREQQIGLKIIQRNVRAWCALWGWSWFKLFARVKPLIQTNKKDEEFDNLQKRFQDLEADQAKGAKHLRDLESASSSLMAEKTQLQLQLEREREALAESEQRAAKVAAQKLEVERQLNELNERLADREDESSGLSKMRHKLENENEMLRKSLQELELLVKKKDMERQAKDQQIHALQVDIGNQDELISKFNKEKKHQDEMNRKLMDELNAETEKVAHFNKSKQKLELALDQAEDALEREKRARQDLEKQRRKAEGELRISHENLEELVRQKGEAESALKKRDAELNAISSRFEDEQSLVARLQRQIKELLSRVQELEEELNAERQSRAKIEKMKNEAQFELEELADRLDEAGGATQAHIELNKRREAEMAKLRRDLEEAALHAENSAAVLRKKHADAVAELSDQLDALHKSRNKLEKEKLALQKDVEELQNCMDTEVKQHQSIDRLAKQLEAQLVETQLKSDEQARQIQELSAAKSRLSSENTDLSRQVEEAENQVAALSRMKTQLCHQLEELRRQLEQESRERQAIALQATNYQLECQQLRDALDEEQDAKAEFQRLASKANAEAQQWRARYENDAIARAEEIEEARRRIQEKAQQVQEQLDLANTKVLSLEKARHRLQQELEDAQVDAEKANNLANALEKKQKGFDKVVDEWRRKCDSLGAELDAAQAESRAASTESFRLRNSLDEANEQMEAVRRENKNLAQELKDLTEQLSEGGRGVHEQQKARRRLELEKEQLQQALEDAEAALEAEESKVLRAQVEVTQIRAEIEKRIAEKEEEFENTRRNHQRALESAEASLEGETRGRAELLKLKKKLENDVHNLEIGLDQAHKANAEAQRNAKRYQETVRELQQQVDEEQRARDDARDQLAIAERRAQILHAEKEELAGSLEQADRALRHAELENAECKDNVSNLMEVNGALQTTKRKFEADFQQLQSELHEALAELKNSEDRAKSASTDAARLAEELRAEQEHAQSQQRARKALETQLKELQARLDEAEALSLKGGKKFVAKLETRVSELESELEAETRRHSDTHKALRNKDRRVRELQFQVDEDKKSAEKMYELVEKLQTKLKTYKRQAEESEQLATTNLNKYRQLQHVVEDAEERADYAENSLSKVRARSRSSVNVMGGSGGGRSPNIFQSRSSASLLRPSSRSGGLAISNSFHSRSAAASHSNVTLLARDEIEEESE